MGVGFDAIPSWATICDGDDGAPFREAGAQLVVLGQTLAQAIEAFRHFLDFRGRTSQRLRAFVDLDAGDGSGCLDEVDERRAVLSLLTNGLVEQDHARNIVPHRLGRAEQHLAVIAPILLRVLDADRVEALLDGAGAFVGGQDALTGGHHGLCDILELLSHDSRLLGQLPSHTLAPMPAGSRSCTAARSRNAWRGETTSKPGLRLRQSYPVARFLQQGGSGPRTR